MVVRKYTNGGSYISAVAQAADFRGYSVCKPDDASNPDVLAVLGMVIDWNGRKVAPICPITDEYVFCR